MNVIPLCESLLTELRPFSSTVPVRRNVVSKGLRNSSPRLGASTRAGGWPIDRRRFRGRLEATVHTKIRNPISRVRACETTRFLFPARRSSSPAVFRITLFPSCLAFSSERTGHRAWTVRTFCVSSSPGNPTGKLLNDRSRDHSATSSTALPFPILPLFAP